MATTTNLSLEKPVLTSTNKIREDFNDNMDLIDAQFAATYLAPQLKNAVTITGGSITGITDLVVSDGGTGVSTLTDGGVLLGSGTGAITAMAVLTDGQMIVGNGTTDPVAESGATLRTSIGCAATAQTFYIGTTQVAINRSSGALTLAGITLTTPDIGTPSAGTLTNCSFPTLNQNTTGSAATLTTARTIGGVSFNGSANITVATATGGFTISGGNLALSTNSITMSGSIGVTGTRVTKLWTADLECTNDITINGTALASTYANLGANTDITSLTGLTTPLGAAYGGTGVANNALNTITFTGNYTLGLTLSANTTLTLPTSGTVATLAGTEILSNKNLTDVDTLNFADATELTISTGAITITQSYHKIDTESDAASDDLTTISGGTAGDIIYLCAENDARTVVLKHDNTAGAGKIVTSDGNDYSLDDDNKVVTLVYNSVDSHWHMVGAAGAGGLANIVEDTTPQLGAHLDTNDFGISFPATQAPDAGANVLDDYEEGTWTPALEFGGNSVDLTYDTQAGQYTKIGRQVTITGKIDLSAKGTSTGTARINGLPFTCKNDEGANSAVTLRMYKIDFANVPMGYVAKNTVLIILEETTEAGAISTLTDVEFENDSGIILSATYFVG